MVIESKAAMMVRCGLAMRVSGNLLAMRPYCESAANPHFTYREGAGPPRVIVPTRFKVDTVPTSNRSKVSTVLTSNHLFVSSVPTANHLKWGYEHTTNH